MHNVGPLLCLHHGMSASGIDSADSTSHKTENFVSRNLCCYHFVCISVHVTNKALICSFKKFSEISVKVFLSLTPPLKYQ